jgi:branched-chain amino acid transport system permease protein
VSAGAARRRLAAAAAAAVALLWPLLYANPFALTIGTLIALSMIGASSLHLVIRTGHVSLAHGAFMGVAAYTCVLVVTSLHLPFVLGLVAGCAASGLLALLVGPVVLRLAGKYFVLVTFLLGEIIRMAFVEWVSLTGGSNGIFNIPPPAPLFASPLAYYYLALAAAAVCIGIVARILGSEIGRAIDSVRVAERLAECSGVPVVRLKVAMFAIACALVGVQGALHAHFLRFIDPTAFNIDVSLNLVVMNVIGGMNSLWGPLIGAVFLTGLPELLRGYVELQHVMFGIVLIAVMAALPGGMVEAAERLRRLLRR